MKVEPHQIRTQIVCDAEYWLSEILNIYALPSARTWSEFHQNKSREAIEKSFSLFLDGGRLKIVSLQCRYIEEPLKFVRPKVQFQIVYELPRLGEIISGRSEFFKEEYSHYAVKGIPSFQEYVTQVEIFGRTPLRLKVPITQPDFQFPLSPYFQTPSQYIEEDFWAALRDFYINPFLLIFCLLMVITMAGLSPRPMGWNALCLLAQLLFGSLAFLLLPTSFFSMNSVIWWGALVVAALPLALSNSRGWWVTLSSFIPALFCWPAVLHKEFSAIAYTGDMVRYAQWGYLLGTLVSVLGSLLMIGIVFYFFRKFLVKMYAALADSFFYSHLRALSGFVTLVSIIEMIKVFLRRS